MEYDDNGKCIDVRNRPKDKDLCEILDAGGVLAGRDLLEDGLVFECDEDKEDCDGVLNEGEDDEIKTVNVLVSLPDDVDCENTGDLGETFERYSEVLADVSELMRKRVERIHEKDRLAVNSLIFNAFIFMQVRGGILGVWLWNLT